MSRTALLEFTKLWGVLGCRGDATVTYRELLAAYSEPHRHYHNLQHIAECLGELDHVRPCVAQPAILEMALWFHDAIYESRSSTNEADSARWAGQCLGAAGLEPATIDRIQALILCTKTHAASAQGDRALIVDLDLSIFGRSSERFWDYERGIAAEYAWVSPALFAEKRAEILTGFLARPALYLTEFFRERYEETARVNLSHALRRLQPPLT